MNLGSGFARINNLYTAPRYPQIPVTPVKRVSGGHGGESAVAMPQNSPKPFRSSLPSGITMTLPNGTFLVGYLIDVYA